MWDWQSIRQLAMHDAAFARVELLECRLLMNGAPAPLTLSLSSSPVRYVEKQGAMPIDPALTITDPNGQLIHSASLQLLDYMSNEDSLSATAENGISVSWDSSAGVLTLSGEASVATYQAALQSVTYTDTSYDPATTPRIAQVTVTDSQFATGSSSQAILITAVNDPPSIQTPPIQTIGSSSQIVFSSAGGDPIIISDVDANGAVEQLTLAVSDGTLHLNEAAGLSFIAGASSGVASMTVTGTLEAINAAIDGLTFTPSSPYASAASLEVSAADLGNSGIGGAQVVNAIVPITVAGPAAPPPTVGTAKPPIPPTVGASDPPPTPPPSIAPAAPTSPVVAVRPSMQLRGIVEASGASVAFLEMPNGAKPLSVDVAIAARNVPVIVTSGPLTFTDKPLFPGPVTTNELAASPRPLVSSPGDFASRPRTLFADRPIAVATTIAAADTNRSFSLPPNPSLRRLPHRTIQIAADVSAAPIESTGFLRELNSIRQQAVCDLRLRMWAGTASMISGGLSLAYFLWMARGGSLLSGLISSIPAWKVIDPLPILDHVGKAGAALKREEDRSLESLIKDATGS